MTELNAALEENHALKARLIEAENALLRESLDYFSAYVNPLDAFRGPEGSLWPEVGSIAGPAARAYAGFTTEAQLADARGAARFLERTNEFAINGHENR